MDISNCVVKNGMGMENVIVRAVGKVQEERK